MQGEFAVLRDFFDDWLTFLKRTKPLFLENTLNDLEGSNKEETYKGQVSEPKHGYDEFQRVIDQISLDSSIQNEPLRECCRQTIEDHAVYNPMMLCQGCQHLIKCFRDQSTFKNYVIFCKSRGRPIQVHFFDKYYVVVFRCCESYR